VQIPAKKRKNNDRTVVSATQDDQEPAPTTLRVFTAPYAYAWHRGMWDCAKPGRKAATKSVTKFSMPLCQRQIFFFLLRPSMVNTRQVVHEETATLRKRIVEERELSVLEKWLHFEDMGQLHQVNGFANIRFATKKEETFYNVVTGIRAEHFERKKTGEQWAEFSVEVVTLTSLATVVLPTSVVDADRQPLIDYCRSLPSRLRKDGYTIDERLRKVCKAHAKQRLRELGEQTPFLPPTHFACHHVVLYVFWPLSKGELLHVRCQGCMAHVAQRLVMHMCVLVMWFPQSCLCCLATNHSCVIGAAASS
jgi:hypothetical protein